MFNSIQSNFSKYLLVERLPKTYVIKYKSITKQFQMIQLLIILILVPIINSSIDLEDYHMQAYFYNNNIDPIVSWSTRFNQTIILIRRNNTKLYDEIYCPNGHIQLVVLSKFSVYSSMFYTMICNETWLALFKEPGTNHLLVMSPIFYQSISDNRYHRWPLLTQLNDITSIRFQMIIQLDTNITSESNETSMKINVDNQTFHLNSTKRQHLLPRQFIYRHESNELPKIREIDINLISESFMTACFVANNLNASCLQFNIPKSNRIECYCEENRLGFLIPLIEMLIIVLIYLLILKRQRKMELKSNSYSTNEEKSRSDEQYIAICCDENDFRYKYLAIFRIGPTTYGFNFEQSYIDIQLMGENNETIGIPQRYSTSNIANRSTLSSLYLNIDRLSPMPPITGIMISHSDGKNLIYFQDFTLINKFSSDHSVEKTQSKSFLIGRYITNEPIIMSFKEHSMERLRKIESDWRELIVVDELAQPEFLSINSFIMALISILTIYCRVGLHLFTYYRHFGRITLEIVIYVLIVSCLLLFFINILENGYRSLKRFNLLEMIRNDLSKRPSEDDNERKDQSIIDLNSKTNCKNRNERKMACHSVLILFYIVTFIFIVLTIYLGTKISIKSALIWSGVNWITIFIVIGLWIIFNEYSLMQNEVESNENDTVLLNERVKSSFHFASWLHYDTNQSNSGRLSNFGPKLSNPKWRKGK